MFLIGGGPAFTTWNLAPIQQVLAGQYRVCRWDMRGVGENAALPFQPGHTALSQWLGDMAAVLPPEPVLLWGHSWGALQVLLFTREQPTRVKGIVLSNPVDPHLRSHEHIERKRFNHPDVEPGLTLEDMGTPVEELHSLRSKVASYFADPAKGWAYAAGFTQADANSRLNVRIWEEYRSAPLEDDDVRKLADKILGLIYCRDDVLQPEALMEYRRLLGPDKHHLLSRCGHFPWEEQPEAYYRLLLQLLSEREEVRIR